MSEVANNRAFVLRADLSHLGDDEVDAAVIKFPGWEDAYGLALTETYQLPDRILFEANFRSLEVTDYPINDMHWPVMSKNMLDALMTVGTFPHRIYPVVMVKDTVTSEERYRDDGTAQPGVEDERFVAVQLLEHQDLFDWDRSTYDSDDGTRKFAENIQVLVLKETDDPLPPLFRLSAYPVPLFISAAGRRALEQAGIKGVIFEEIAGFKG